MLAKLADRAARRATAGSSSRSGTASARIVFRDGDDVYIQSRDLKPLDRYFPELARRCSAPACRERCVVDGEIVIASRARARLRRAAAAPPSGRVARARSSRRRRPASFVAFDLLARGRRRSARRPQAERRARLGAALARRAPPRPPHARDARPRARRATGSSASRAPASTASSPSRDARPTSRASARWSRSSTRAPPTAWSPASAGTSRARARSSARCCSGSTTTTGALHHVGVTSSFTMATRAAAREELEPLREDALDGHPWREWAAPADERDARCRARRAAGARARTSRGSRCASSACARWSTTTCRATASATPRSSCAGGPTSRRRTAATTSSRSRRPYELAEIFGAGSAHARQARADASRPRIVVGIERLLRRPQRLGHVLAG